MGISTTYNTPFFCLTILTTPNGCSIASHILAQQRQKFHTGYNGPPHIHPQNCSFRWGGSTLPSTLHIPWATTPNCIQIHSAIFPQYIGQAQRLTHRQTDRQEKCTRKMTSSNILLTRRGLTTLLDQPTAEDFPVYYQHNIGHSYWSGELNWLHGIDVLTRGSSSG